MGILITVIVGGLVGWIASIIMRTDSSTGILADVVIGIVGSFLGSWIFGSIFNIGSAFSAGSFSFIGIIWGIVGSVILIAILRAFRVVR